MKALSTLLLTLFTLACAHAYDPLADEELNDYTPPSDEWQESTIKIPDSFDSTDLQTFTLRGRQDRFEYAIERGSLQAGPDGVMRFLLVIRSAQGAVNSSYEGLRCGYRQAKVYAYGSASGLSPLAAPQWQDIPKSSSGYQAILYEDLLCNLSTGQPNPPDAVIRAMHSGSQVEAPFLPSGRD